ncbi:ribonuclease Z [Pediococcus ethanolidurans]|uniref:Ribonuclease Z n=1 Tax=Pediococcus ethanolidurans TaxID=319653 RepID=A0A0R2JY54_9LACO|nr:ribonuclease Z [Pediococcus ethanolidurans]KRN82145.1 beta-lactamase superfamily hydrolase [Pediococcus ethanolidurans]MBU7555704.1 ribonuclease Z [Pediococcus ethanolidurans]MBU7563321.1 ribonuclease Z [Pediococcus ethanolidurans]MCT4397151.1 ribonuclease Z [Pediococcus ethanolidurans]MCV3315147.1 ribonuclease Z [Pediococcus ethanolidurans]
MELEFLGTGAGVPGKFRNVTSVALKLLDERNSIWLFDVGEGTQQQILRTTIKPRKIDKIFITHLHGDHLFGLPGLLSSRSFQGGESELVIYGPKGIRQFVQTAMRVSDSHLSYPIRFVELGDEGVIFEDAKFKVSFLRLDHRIESVGYRIVEKSHPGQLQVEKLKEMHIPSGPVYGQLKRGEKVMLDDGRQIDGQDFLGAPQPGRIVTILGDTRKTKNSFLLAQNADVLVHESTFAKNESKLARNYYHSTNVQAASIAKEAHVRRLILTHISARYTGKMANELQKQAQTVFKATKVVHDFDIINVPLR